MANSATAQTAIDIQISEIGARKVTPVLVVLDTVNSDLTVYTPATGYYAAIVGMQYQEADAHSLTIKSATTALITLERPANSQIDWPIVPGVRIVGALSAALKLRAATAGIASILLYVVEFKKLILSK